jgi:hypothetical protein
MPFTISFEIGQMNNNPLLFCDYVTTKLSTSIAASNHHVNRKFRQNGNPENKETGLAASYGNCARLSEVLCSDMIQIIAKSIISYYYVIAQKGQ